MAASFRNVNEIIDLAGVDLVTISPTLLDQLSKMSSEVQCQISAKTDVILDMEPISRHKFEGDIEKDECARDLLKQGIDKFKSDTEILENMMASAIKEL